MDQRKLDEYLYSVRDVEKRLAGADRLRLSEEGVPDYPRQVVFERTSTACGAHAGYGCTGHANRQHSNSVIHVLNAGSNRSYPEIQVSGHPRFHTMESEDKQANVAKINRFQIDRFGYLLKRLDSILEDNGKTLLDNSMLVYGIVIGDGDRHNHDDLQSFWLVRPVGVSEQDVTSVTRMGHHCAIFISG